MPSLINVPLPTSDFLGLANFLRERGSPRDPVEVIQEAVAYWMENAAWKAESMMPETIVDDASRGYMWKSVFLPAGTLVRMKYAGQLAYGRVEGDHLMYKGESMSPNQFAFAVAGGSRDAWRDLWVKRPADTDYVPADTLRR